jgi:hypothetical protein
VRIGKNVGHVGYLVGQQKQQKDRQKMLINQSVE